MAVKMTGKQIDDLIYWSRSLTYKEIIALRVERDQLAEENKELRESIKSARSYTKKKS